jgi:nitroreductase
LAGSVLPAARVQPFGVREPRRLRPTKERPLDTFEALYTTRAMRRVNPDPIPEDVVKRILDAAIRAPSPGNRQSWRFVTVTDRELMGKLGDLYARSWEQLQAAAYKGMRERAVATGDKTTQRVLTSGDWLAANFSQVPLVVLAYIRNDPDGSGIYPAVWNLMLAARTQGVGTTLTTVLHHFAEQEVADPRQLGGGCPAARRERGLLRTVGRGTHLVGTRAAVELLAGLDQLDHRLHGCDGSGRLWKHVAADLGKAQVAEAQ